MPNYNSSEFIQKTIKSVLSQTFTNWELIIIDDNSNNKTKEILKKFTRNKKIRIYFLKKTKAMVIVDCLELIKQNPRSLLL